MHSKPIPKVNSLLKFILLPFSLLYGLAILLRNFMFGIGLFSSEEYPFPVISIGNLSVGGTGKTPHAEYIISHLRKRFKLASLSRGYGRKTKGYKLATAGDNANSIGDEPFQIFQKFDDIHVAVAEKRKEGIRQLRKLDHPPQIIVLDDAFQHQSVKPGLNILLTDYSKLYKDDLILPSGRLREWKSGAKRADLIIVTKSPSVLSPLEIRRISQSLNPQDYQKVFFSYINYKKAIPLNRTAIELYKEKDKFKTRAVLLVSAIANPDSLILHLKRSAKEVQHLSFKDHYYFKAKDYKTIKTKLDNLLSQKRALVITEKDAVKFDASQFNDVPVFSIPITIKFHEHQELSFSEEIDNYVRSYSKIS
ncbi:MAG: tetraacyldisaccharide 4'-kinase [Vicingaceae bacterium]